MWLFLSTTRQGHLCLDYLQFLHYHLLLYPVLVYLRTSNVYFRLLRNIASVILPVRLAMMR